VEWLDVPEREKEQWLKRAAFGAARETVLEALGELTAWYRDLVAASVRCGASSSTSIIWALREDGSRAVGGAERAAELVRGRGDARGLNLQPARARALFVQLRRGLCRDAAVWSVSDGAARRRDDAVRRPDGEGSLRPYADHLPSGVRHVRTASGLRCPLGGADGRHPRHDHAALADGEDVYVHCRAGIGRTRTVIGCHQKRHGLDPGAQPETSEQRAFVRDWPEGR
jgi:hypothetical protein